MLKTWRIYEMMDSRNSLRIDGEWEVGSANVGINTYYNNKTVSHCSVPLGALKFLISAIETHKIQDGEKKWPN